MLGSILSFSSSENLSVEFPTQAPARLSQLQLAMVFDVLQNIVGQGSHARNLFVESLKEASQLGSEDLSLEFLADLSLEDFRIVLNFLIENRALYENLAPGEAIRIPKCYERGERFFPRTVTILRDHRVGGEFQCIVHTGSKTAELDPQNKPIKKREKKKSSGAVRYGKPAAWRVGGRQQIPLWKSTAVLTDANMKEILALIDNEINMSAIFNSPNVLRIVKGPIYISRGKTKINLFSDRGDIDLFDLVESTKLTQEQQNQIITDLLKALQEIHSQTDQNGYPLAHQDVKPENIIIQIHEINSKISYSAILGDLEFVGNPNRPFGTIDYFSPKLFHSFFQKDSSFLMTRPLHLKKILVTKLYERGLPAAFLENCENVSQADDIWALGIVVFIIKYGTVPGIKDLERISADPLLSVMLCVDERERANVSQLIAIHQKSMLEAEMEAIKAVLLETEVGIAECLGTRALSYRSLARIGATQEIPLDIEERLEDEMLSYQSLSLRNGGNPS